MHVEFTKAEIPEDVPALLAFDRKVFPKDDVFEKEEWLIDEPYWMLVDKARVGCCAFQPNRDFRDDLAKRNPARKGSLYITTTGILPKMQGKGFGRLLKVWQIAYAKLHGFDRIVTNCRMRNAAIIGLNHSLGYRYVRATPHYYSGPDDATVVMELKLN